MKRIRSLLILRGGALGDFLLTLPTMAAVRHQWPSIPMDLAAYPRFAELVVRAGWVRKVHSLDAALMAQLYVPAGERDPALAESLRHYDAVICYLEDPDGTLANTLETAGIHKRVFISPHVTQGHAIDHFMSALHNFGFEVKGGDSAVLNITPEPLRPEIAGQLPVRVSFAVIHPGSGSARKNWPVDRFVRLAQRIRGEQAVEPVFLLGEAEAGLEQVLKNATPSLIFLTNLGLLEVAAVLKRAQFYLGNDSGITHLSAALGVPTWALFGPTNPAHWAPRGRQVHVVKSPGDGIHAMDELTEETVWAAIKTVGKGVSASGGERSG